MFQKLLHGLCCDPCISSSFYRFASNSQNSKLKKKNFLYFKLSTYRCELIRWRRAAISANKAVTWTIKIRWLSYVDYVAHSKPIKTKIFSIDSQWMHIELIKIVLLGVSGLRFANACASFMRYHWIIWLCWGWDARCRRSSFDRVSFYIYRLI